MVKRLFLNSKQLFTREQRNILSAASIITAANFLSALFGFFKTRLLLRFFSASLQLRQILDAYWVALRLPELLFQLLVVGSVSAAFIPVFSKYLQDQKSQAYRISSSVMNVVLIAFFILSALVFIFAPQFNSAITGTEFSGHQLAVAVNLSRIMIFAQLFFALSNFLTGVIQAQKRFLVPALSPLVYNLGIIIGIFTLVPFIGIYGAAVGVLLGALLHLLLQLPLALKLGFSYQPIINLKHPGVKEMFRLMPPRVLAISVTQIELSAMVYFATFLSAGSLTILQIAQQLILAPIRMFAVPIGQASLPFLSKESAGGDTQQFKQTLLHSLRQILYLAFPAGMLLLVLRIPLVRIVYGSRQFPWVTTLLTGKTVAILSLSLAASAVIHLLTRAFYALHNTRTPFTVALISVVFNILFASISVFKLHFGVLGLASSIALSAVVQASLLILLLGRSIGGFSMQELIIPSLKMIFAGSTMAVSLWLPMRLLDKFVFDTSRTLNLILLTLIASLIGMLVYLGLSKLLRIKELNAFLSLLRRIGNWQKVLSESEEVLEPASQAQEVKPA